MKQMFATLPNCCQVRYLTKNKEVSSLDTENIRKISNDYLAIVSKISARCCSFWLD
jgi:hypothetical protein